MRTFFLIMHLMVTLAMIVLILFQKTEGGGPALGGSSSSGSMLSVRGAANLLTRSTGILGALFLATNIILAILARYENQATVITRNAPATQNQTSTTLTDQVSPKE